MYFRTGMASVYIFWTTRGVWGPSFKINLLFFHYWGYILQAIQGLDRGNIFCVTLEIKIDLDNVVIHKPQDIYNIDIHPDFWSQNIHGVSRQIGSSEWVTEVLLTSKNFVVTLPLSHVPSALMSFTSAAIWIFVSLASSLHSPPSFRCILPYWECVSTLHFLLR